MSEDNSIFHAALPEPYMILGLRLRPFSLGHYVILKRHGCAFVSDNEAEATHADLVFACLVCSMTFDEFNEWVRSGVTVTKKALAIFRAATFRASIPEMLAALRGNNAELEVMAWGRKVGFFDLRENVKLFRQYLDESSRAPKYWIEREGKSSGAHWAQCVFITLTGDLGFTRDQAYNMPLREALLHYFKHAENQGAVTLMTDDEIPEEEVALGS